ncbi:MAG: DsrE family protein [Fervidicoccaceae archaeon]
MVKKYRAMFHISSFDDRMFGRMMSNIKNLVTDLGDDEVDIAVVANGDGVKHFTKSSLKEKGLEEIMNMLKWKVRFYICRNSLRALGIKEEEILEHFEIVPAGITQIVKLQSEGFAYIKP